MLGTAMESRGTRAPRPWRPRAFGLSASATVLVVGMVLVSSPVSADIATGIVAAGEHACALTTGGGVKCWGENANGELGDGTTTTRPTAVDVIGLTSGVMGIAAGFAHTCALTTSGGIKCWGANLYGQLGDGSTTPRLEPVDVVGLASGVAAISAGQDHTCALTTGGAVKCWGYNDQGSLGNGTTTTAEPTPLDVTGLGTDVTAIAAGQFHTCALTTAGGAKCWGFNEFGGLGDGTTMQRLEPVDVAGLDSGVAAISGGYYHTCALTIAGSVKCWGYNAQGALGDGTTTQRLEPVDVTGLASGVVGISSGSFHTCALTSSGGILCWGDNGVGQLGDGTRAQRPVPGDVLGLTTGVAAIAAGSAQTCAVTATGGARCWGNNVTGTLGNGLTAYRTLPVAATQLTDEVTTVVGGARHTCVRTPPGGIRCWGDNGSGQLGDGTTTMRIAPVGVAGVASGATALAANASQTCALTAGGGVKCWGDNANGQLGDGTTTARSTPVDVVGLASGITGVSTGRWHTCALTTAGGVKCWGHNAFGQLGDGTTTQRSTAVDVNGLSSGVTAIATGAITSCALTTSGAVKCWGYNGHGEVGDGTTTHRSTPVGVSGLGSGVASIALGSSHSCAVTTAGGALCWGDNVSGQLGDGTTTRRATPVGVTGLTSGVTAIGGGSLHTCAMTAAGGVKCWGENAIGQLGDGTKTARTAPVDVAGLGSGVSGVGVGGAHTCALLGTGGLVCWGGDYDGELGDGELGYATSPVVTLGFGPTCGNGAVEPTEQCDDGNTAAGDCCSSSCQLESSATTCRGARGDCDTAETCTGSSATCPADGFVTAGTACSDDGNGCTNDSCDGAGACTHPNNNASCDDGLFCNGGDTCSAGSCSVHAGDPCRGGTECADVCDEAADSCDAPAGTPCADDGRACSVDVCDGTGACRHPADHAGTPCRPVSGECDLAEACDGTSPTCPPDLFRPSSYACRPAVGECDVAEHCSGSAAHCPADGFVAAGIACADDGQPCTSDACDGDGTCEHLTLPDSDADSVCDAQDICTNLGSGRDFASRPRCQLGVSRINTDTTLGNDELDLKGSFALPVGLSFADLDPRARGARVVVQTALGSTVLDVTLPPGTYAGKGTRGWRTDTRGNHWRYVDKTVAPLGGVTDLRATDRSHRATGGVVALRASGKNGVYPVASGDVPLAVIVLLGNQTDAIAGLCAESAFVASDCSFNPSGGSVRCRR